jgi:hypothetical protein
MAYDQASQSGAAAGPDTTPNKAQAEFDKYTKRMQAQQAGPASAAAPPGGLSWAVPSSVTMLPRHGDGGTSPPGSLADSIGTSLRLGVDVVNAALAGGVRLLGGFSAAYGHEDCGCESCCEPSCCEPDCCGCECCDPGVGSCC